MDFFEFKQWLKKHDLTFELEGWSGLRTGIQEISNQKDEEQLVEVGDICGMFES